MTKKNNEAYEIFKIAAIVEEVEASFNFISSGLSILKEQKSVVSNNHVVLQLLSSGFERLVKILLLLKDKHTIGSYPELQKARVKFEKYNNGHGIQKMLDELIDYSSTVPLMQSIPMVKEDIQYLESDPAFQNFMKIITDFSIAQRYFYIDLIVLDKPSNNVNPFTSFKQFMHDFNKDIDVNLISHEEEESRAINQAIICIEKGVRAIVRFFIHGFDSLGKQYYNQFAKFIMLQDKNLGTIDYSEKKVNRQDLYNPINFNSLDYVAFILKAKSKTLLSKNYPDWPFFVNDVQVYYVSPMFYFVKIDNKIYGLTGATTTKYEIPLYSKSDKLKPRGYATFLLEEAQKLHVK